MFHIILLCAALGYISAQSDSSHIAASLVAVPEAVKTDQQIGAWVEVMKTMRDTSSAEEKRVEKIKQLLLKAFPRWPPNYAENLVEAADNEWKLVNSGSSKLKEVYNKSYDLKSDAKLYKMSPDQRRAEGEKLYNSLSDDDKKKLEEIWKAGVERHQQRQG
ncbi:hypothetical protein Aduo_004763 [Ancylostoma duodenale]